MAETKSLTIWPAYEKYKYYRVEQSNFGSNVTGPTYSNITTQSDGSARYRSDVSSYSSSAGGVVYVSNTYLWTGTAIYFGGITGVILSGSFSFYASAPGKLVLLPSGFGSSSKYDDIASGEVLMTFNAGNWTYTFSDSENAMAIYRRGVGVIASYQTSNNSNNFNYLTNFTGSVTYIANGTLPQVDAVSPVSESVLAENDNVFRWTYSHDTGMPMTSWALHIVRNGVDTVVQSGTGAATSCTVPADTLSIGTAQWYVSVTAEEEGYTLAAASDPVYIVIRANPSTSDVSADGKPRLTVSWTAHSQQAAQVRVGDTIYPVIWSDDGEYKIPEIMSDGVYAVSVRTQTMDGEWSDWSEDIYTEIINDAPSGTAAPILTGSAGASDAVLSWTAVPTSVAYILYRNDVPIYTGDLMGYADMSVCGFAEYKVRALFSNGYYIESDVQTLLIYPNSDTLVWFDGETPHTMTIRLHPQLPERQWDEASDTEFRDYAGRVLPVAVSNGHLTRSLTLTAAYRTPSEASALLGLLGKTVIYKSKKGEACRGVIVSASRNSSLTEAITYRITATDDDERAYLT